MEVDSSPTSLEVDSSPTSYAERILERLSNLDIPDEVLTRGQHGLISFYKCHKGMIGDLVAAIIPDYEEVENVEELAEVMVWLQWLMFEEEPKFALEHLAKLSSDQRGVCGAVWGNNDIAYRCTTCENDPTCAICVPCFENGNHKDHDYAIIYTSGGCCDCGDATAWKREGFCSKHKGSEQIQQLPKHISDSLGPVLDVLLNYWKNNLAKVVSEEIPASGVEFDADLLKYADDLTSAVVDMLLDFCKQSESLLSFISVRVYSSGGLLDILLRAERCLADSVVEKLHELLLKMLGEPTFKYEFAKLFVLYYPSAVNYAIGEGSDDALKKYPLLSNFSVQILTVPTLTPRLVHEINLLGVLLQCLETIFLSCAGEDGKLQVVKWANLYDTTLRIVEDVRFVMSHSAVPKYMCNCRRDLVRTWMRLLAFVQGMNTQKRETGSHIEEENEHVHLPFVLCNSISNILSLLVAGAFSKDVCDNSEETLSSTYSSDAEDKHTLRHAKVGRLSEESSINCNSGKTEVDHDVEAVESLPSSALWLVYECLKSVENWLVVNKTSASLGPLFLKTSDGSSNNFHVLRRTLSRFRKNRNIFKSSASSDCSEYRQAIGQGVPNNSDKNLLEGENSSELEGLLVLSSSSWPNITYDVSLPEISVHLPLHQLLSMMLQRFLKEFYSGNLTSSGPICLSAESSLSRNSNILGLILAGSHPYGFSAFLMEHPLRIRVFCAEVHAGMWRRNGDAPLVFSDWYRSVRWSEQGQELDLFLLQVCASLAPPDLFVQRILERFGLSNYLSLNLEQPSEHEPVMVTEMLSLLIQIVKERRFCGLTTEQCLVRELVYKLSIGDATRSHLVKSLPRDLSKFDELQKILDRVAAYSHPSGLTQGTYKLRASYWKELDLYHPRWNLRDQQAAVERYSRFCNVSALTAQIPRWSKIYHSLKGIAKIATCKSVLQIFRAVLFYAVFTEKSTASRASDGVLLTALHLLALALDICRSHKESGDLLCDLGNNIPILLFATEEISTNKHGDHSMLSLLFLLMKMYEKENAQNLVESADYNLPTLILGLLQTFAELEPACAAKLLKLSPQLVSQFPHSTLADDTNVSSLIGNNEMRKAKARERQAAMLEKMRNQQSKFLESFSGQNDEMDDVQFDKDTCGSEGLDDSLEQEVICSLCHEHKPDNPVSFLVLLQKSKLSSFVGQGPLSWDQVKGSSHACEDTVASDDACSSTAPDCPETFSWDQLEDLVQSAVNDFASTGLPAEVNSFVEFTKARFPSIKTSHFPCLLNSRVERLEPFIERVEESAYQLIKESKSDLRGKFRTDENSKKRSSCSELLLLGKYIASLPKEPLDTPSASNRSSRITKRIKSGSSPLHPEYDNLGTSGNDGINVSSCGHAVHQGCLDRYLASLRERHIRRIAFEGGPVVDPDQGEFLCPVCRGLANSIMPTLPPKMRRVPRLPTVSSSGTDADDFSTMSDHGCLLCLKEGLSLIEKIANFVSRNENINALPVKNMRLENLETIIHFLCGIYYPGKDKVLETGRVSDSVILWNTLKYSLISTEIAARSRRGSLRPNYDLGALYQEINSSTGFILSLILDLIQNARTSYRDVLLRFHAIQIFAKSLGCGTTDSEDLRQGGNVLYILENPESKVQYPDIQLWSLASEPVIAHDAFSSFMWILFCLPWPMLSCRQSYFSLVHVFYVASMIQAIIVSHKNRRSVEVGKSRGDMITEIYRVIGEHPEAGKYFESRFITDPASEAVDAIRGLSFPFLRRCALLWKLINGSRITPFSSYGSSYPENENRGSNYSYESYVGPDANAAASRIAEEIHEVNELKRFFGIPPDDFIVNDETTKSTALSWLNHFIEVHGGAYKCRRVLKCTPAVPFRLMILPRLFQDLLQRYIKKSCPECGVVNDEPALCLLCGKLCSPNWKPCCRESSCQAHAAACGAGMGVFLLMRKTSVLLQRSAIQAHWPSPYLDAYGEEDIEMRRGKPLFLNEERYAALTHMVASHGIDRSSEVLRQTTTIGAFFMF